MRIHFRLLSALALALVAASLNFAQQPSAPAPQDSAGPAHAAPLPDDPPPPPDFDGPPAGPEDDAMEPGFDPARGGRGWGDAHGREGWGMRGHGFGRHGDRGEMLSRLVENPELREKLGITADQAAKIRQQTTDFRKAEIRTGADLRIKRMELQDLLSAEKPDRAAIDRKLQEVGAAQLAREKSSIDFRLTMRDALTPEQKQKLRQLMEERRQSADRRPGRRGPGPQGMRPRAPQPAPAPAPPTQN